jgi:hypothetical protein
MNEENIYKIEFMGIVIFCHPLRCSKFCRFFKTQFNICYLFDRELNCTNDSELEFTTERTPDCMQFQEFVERFAGKPALFSGTENSSGQP